MSAAKAANSGEEIWLPKGNPWIIAIAVSLAAFMEVLDTSIANVALPHIAGNLGASNDESTWVLTSYLVSTPPPRRPWCPLLDVDLRIHRHPGP